MIPNDNISTKSDSDEDCRSERIEDPDGFDLEFNESQATSYLSMLSSLFTGSSYNKPAYAIGIDSWVPSDPEIITKVPENSIPNYNITYPLVGEDVRKNGVFGVFTRKTEAAKLFSVSPSTAVPCAATIPLNDVNSSKSDKETTIIHHLIFTFWKGNKENKHVLSLFRSEKISEVIALCERCRECRDLFFRDPKGVEKRIYLSQILFSLRSHILWKSVHIAASLGNMVYFQKKNRRITPRLQNYCQPEGLTPLMIAVKKDYVLLSEYLLELGSDASALTIHGQDNILHLAAVTSFAMVKMLMKSGKCSDLINQGNKLGNSPLYIAVTGANAYCAQELKAHGATLTAKCHIDALKTPLIEMMKKPNVEVAALKAIFEKHADAHHHTDPLTGNTALHCALFKKTLLSLLELKSCELNLDVRNLQMQTPLHIYVLKNDLQLVMALICYKVDMDAKDRDGNTALHLAVMNHSLDIVHALLVMGAEPNISNSHGETPRHIAAKFKNNEIARDIVHSLIICGGKRCVAGHFGCTSACVHKDNFVADPVSKTEACKTASHDSLGSPNAGKAEHHVTAKLLQNFPQQNALHAVLSKLRALSEQKLSNNNIISVLALDGGGIKGLVIVQVLIALQKYLDEPLLNYFDWIAGTSTGSYVSSGFFKDIALRDMLKLYTRFKDRIFGSQWSRPYNTEALLEFLKGCYGAETTMADIQYPKVFFTTVRADTFPVKLELMRNYQLPLTVAENEALGYMNPKDILLWKAVRRSSAAPTYFPAAEGKFIDGGIVSNNPTLDLLGEIHSWNNNCQFLSHPQSVEIGCVVSIGTGMPPDVAVEPSLYEMSDMFGLLRGMKNLTKVVIDQVTATEGAPVSRSRAWCHSIGTPFYRLNPQLHKDIPIDAIDDLDLVRMMWDTVKYAHEHRKEFIELASLLKSIGTTKTRRTNLARCTPKAE